MFFTERYFGDLNMVLLSQSDGENLLLEPLFLKSEAKEYQKYKMLLL